MIFIYFIIYLCVKCVRSYIFLLLSMYIYFSEDFTWNINSNRKAMVYHNNSQYPTTSTSFILPCSPFLPSYSSSPSSLPPFLPLHVIPPSHLRVNNSYLAVVCPEALSLIGHCSLHTDWLSWRWLPNISDVDGGGGKGGDVVSDGDEWRWIGAVIMVVAREERLLWC